MTGNGASASTSPKTFATPAATPTASPTLRPIVPPASNGYFQLPGAAGTPAAAFDDLSAVDVCGTAADQLTLAQATVNGKDPAFARWTLRPNATLTQLSLQSAVTGCQATLVSGNPSGARADVTLVLRTEAGLSSLASFVADPTTVSDPMTQNALGLSPVTGAARSLGPGATGRSSIAGVVAATASGLDARYWLGPHITLAVHVSLQDGGPDAQALTTAAESLARRFVSGPLPRQRTATSVSTRDLGPVCLTVATPTALRGTPASTVALTWAADTGQGTCSWQYGAIAAPTTLAVTFTAQAGRLVPRAGTVSGTSAQAHLSDLVAGVTQSVTGRTAS